MKHSNYITCTDDKQDFSFCKIALSSFIDGFELS